MTIIDTRNPPADPFQHDGPQTSWERPMPETPTCETCGWWVQHIVPEYATTGRWVGHVQVEPGKIIERRLCSGTCRRVASWPERGISDFCGEHTPKETADA